MFRGSMVALVTPMQANGEIDYDAVAKLLELHIECQTDAIVVAGTTGESGALSPTEWTQLVKFAVGEVRSRVPVIAGSGAVSTQLTLEKTKTAMEIGVDGCLLMCPPYIRPTQEGLYQHFKTIAQKVAVPQILYNVPARTACDLYPETIAKLANIPNVVAVKEASGELARVSQILRACDDKVTVLSGDDALTHDALLMGAKGVISVTANVAPKAVHDLCQAIFDGDKPLANLINDKLATLNQLLFCETNPIPVKWALAELGLITNSIRLPMTPLSPEFEQDVRRALKRAGLC